MQVFVVGATGVLGRWLVPLLVREGHRVRALVRTREKAQALVRLGAEPAPGDLLAPGVAKRLGEALAGCQAVVHAASAIPRDMAAPGAWDANTRLRTDGTRLLLEASLAAGVERYLQHSIVMAYPESGDRWLDEATPLDTSPARAVICAPVIAMEALVRATPSDRLAWCILRGGSFVGPGTGQDGLIADLQAGRAVVPGDGTAFFSPVHAADMAAAVVAALQSARPGSVFNVADEPLRHGDYVDRLALLIGAEPPRREPALPRLPSCRASSQAARAELGWTPEHSIWPGAGGARRTATAGTAASIQARTFE